MAEKTKRLSHKALPIKQNRYAEINPNGKIQKTDTKHSRSVTLNMRNEYYDACKNSEYSLSMVVEMALTNYFKNGFVMRLDNIIQLLYEEILMLDKLKEVGKMGTIEFNEDYLLQIESVKEAIRILENSPLMEGKVQ